MEMIRLGDLVPTQSDDGELSHEDASSPLEYCVDGGRKLVIHGMHRYYRGLEAHGPGRRVPAVRKPTAPAGASLR
jgi:hypothetical protein